MLFRSVISQIIQFDQIRRQRCIFLSLGILPASSQNDTNECINVSAILHADGANHGADNMEGSFVIYPYQEYKSREMQII